MEGRKRSPEGDSRPLVQADTNGLNISGLVAFGGGRAGNITGNRTMHLTSCGQNLLDTQETA